jgi:AcrR family transcriptional regulator
MGKGAETKDAILSAAIQLMSTNGINAVSVRRIQEEAGVNIALAYHHFGSRDGLLAAVVNRSAQALLRDWERELEHFEGRADDPPDPRMLLSGLFRPVVLLSTSEPQAASLLGQLLVNPDTRLEELATTVFGDVLARFGRLLRASVPSEVSTYHFEVSLEMLTGSLITLLTRPGHKNRFSSSSRTEARGRALLAETVDFCLAGLTSPTLDPPGMPISA